LVILRKSRTFKNPVPINEFKKGDIEDQFTPTISLADSQTRILLEFSSSKSN
jgi:hypothetical protein